MWWCATFPTSIASEFSDEAWDCHTPMFFIWQSLVRSLMWCGIIDGIRRSCWYKVWVAFECLSKMVSIFKCGPAWTIYLYMVLSVREYFTTVLLYSHFLKCWRVGDCYFRLWHMRRATACTCLCTLLKH